MSKMKERLHESGFCEHGFRENRKCHQCDPEPDVLKDIPAPTPNSATESALLEALEKIIAEVSERRVGHREKIAEIARTAIDQARGEK